MSQASAAWRAEQLTKQFYRWELRGRGWKVFENAVSPEPPFAPFAGHFIPYVPPAEPLADPVGTLRGLIPPGR